MLTYIDLDHISVPIQDVESRYFVRLITRDLIGKVWGVKDTTEGTKVLLQTGAHQILGVELDTMVRRIQLNENQQKILLGDAWRKLQG